MKPLRKKSKTPSYFSHEFIIANHGDIVSVFAMFFIGGVMFPKTAHIASKFTMLQHNESIDKPTGPPELMYTVGRYDLCGIFFYSIVCIILHAVLQEYILDKIIKKLHLPRSYQMKFNESAQLLVFYAASIYWAIYTFLHENAFSSFSDLWSDYPHAFLPFWIKMFFIIQISYWLHNYPELYFQKVTKSEITKRIYYSTLFLVGITASYFLNFSKLAIIIILIHYITDVFYHLARAMKFYGFNYGVPIWFSIYNWLFIPARIICTVLAFLTFYYGLPKYSVPTMVITEGNYNTWLIRLNCMLFVFLTQAHMVWTFINYHFSKMRDRNSKNIIESIYSTGSENLKRKEKKKGKHDEDSKHSPESHREVHHRKSKQKSS